MKSVDSRFSQGLLLLLPSFPVFIRILSWGVVVQHQNTGVGLGQELCSKYLKASGCNDHPEIIQRSDLGAPQLCGKVSGSWGRTWDG